MVNNSIGIECQHSIANGYSSATLQILCGICTMLVATNANGEELPSIDQIQQIWSTRQKSVSSIDCSWNSVEFMTAKQAGGAGQNGAKPTEDLTTDTSSRFVFDNRGNTRHDHKTLSWSSKENKFVDHQLQQAYVNGLRTLVYPKTHDFPSAHIKTESVADVMSNIKLMPIKMAFFPGDPDFGTGVFANRKSLSITGTAEVLGHNCVLVKESVGDGLSLQERILYVDLQRDYLPVRWELYSKNRLLQMVEVTEYEEVSNLAWMPVATKTVWKYDENGQPTWSFASSMDSYEVNRPIDPAVFELEIPDGAWVKNYDTDASYIKKREEKRWIVPGEFDGTNYEQLLTTNTGEARVGLKKADSSTSWRTWLVTLNVAFIVIFAGVILRRWLQQDSRSSQR